MLATAFVFLCVLVAYIVALALGRSYRALMPWFLIAVTLRLVVLVLDMAGLWHAPNSSMDAAGFIRHADSLSTQSWSDIFGVLRFGSTNNYVAIGASVFKIVGFHPYGMQATNLLVGTIGVCVTSRLVADRFGPAAATGAALLLCLYPFSAFNSAIALREEFVVFFLVCGLTFLARWAQRGDIVPFFIANCLFLLSAAFHPGMVAAVVATTGFYFVDALKGLSGRGDKRSAVINAAVGLTMFAGSMAALASGVDLGKDMELTLDAGDIAGVISEKFDRTPMGGSAYPTFVTRGDPVAQPWLIPARVAYFLYSPFPWDLRSPAHVFGLLAGILYGWLSIRAYRALARKLVCGRMRVLAWIFIALTFIFAIGTTNSGTAIRHKTKFFPLLVVLAAPTFRRRVVFGSPARPSVADAGA